MQGKRGLSAVVTTLLIILLSLVVVGVVWAVITGFIKTGSEQIEIGKFTLDLQIKSVNVQGDDVTVTVVVRRNPGKGELVGMNFVFSDGSNSEVIREDTILEELDEETFTFTLTKFSTSDLKDVSVAPIYELNSGKEESGNVADMFDVKEGAGITGGVISEALGGNFEALGFVNVGRVEYPGGGNKAIKFTNVIVDPLDVHLGDNQTFTAYVSSSYEITEVTTRTQLDNEVLDLPLEKQVDGSYSASWEVYDTHTNVYRTTFIAKDSGGNENNITITWTDPCSGLNHGSDSTLSVDCTVGVNQVDGLDTGDITIGANKIVTLNSGSIFAWTPGSAIRFESGAEMRFGSGSSLKKGYLHYFDSDQDLYASNGTYIFSGSSDLTGSGFTRAKDATASSDCLDSDADVYTTSTTTASDNDQDGYTDTSGTGNCRGGSTTVSGRTYYKDTSGSFTWLTDSQKLGTNDADDANVSCQVDWYLDADNDDFCPDATKYCVANGASGYRSSCSFFSDCNDNNGFIYQNYNALFPLGEDVDQDRYSKTGGSSSGCTGAIQNTYWHRDADGTYKWIADMNALGVDDDCKDADSTVNTGVTAWFTTAGSNNYDYDCSGSAVKQYTTTGGACRTCEYLEDDTCNQIGSGSLGWTGAIPACGSTSTYTNFVGVACSTYDGDFDSCGGNLGCIPPSRTQGCH